MSILWVCFFQTIAISWIFGGRKFCDCIHQMMGIRLNYFWYICWVVFAPVIMAVSIASRKIPRREIKKKKKRKERTNFFFLFFSVHLYIPMRPIQAFEIWKQLRISDVGGGDRRLPQFVIHDLDSCLRCLLRGRYSRIHKRGEILFVSLICLVVTYNTRYTSVQFRSIKFSIHDVH